MLFKTVASCLKISPYDFLRFAITFLRDAKYSESSSVRLKIKSESVLRVTIRRCTVSQLQIISHKYKLANIATLSHGLQRNYFALISVLQASRITLVEL